MRAVVGRPVALQKRVDLNWPWGYRVTSDVIGSSSKPLNVIVTNHSTPHSKGAWSELIASTSHDYAGIALMPDSNRLAGTDTSRLVDIGIGAASSEVVIVPDYDIGYVYGPLSSQALTNEIRFPVHIPRGSRVALRAQGAQASDADDLWCMGFLAASTGVRPPTRLASAGINSAASQGTQLTKPGSTHTKGAWTQLTASTAQPFRLLILQLSRFGSAGTSGNALVDLAVGAAGAEVVIRANQPLYTNASEFIAGPRTTEVTGHIPAGSRLAVRYQTSDTAQDLTASVIGVPY